MEEIKFDDDEPIPPTHKKNVFEKHKHYKHCIELQYAYSNKDYGSLID
jgi:hypothetical protein